MRAVGIVLLFFAVGCKPGPRPTHRGLYQGGVATVLTTCGDARVYWIQASAAMNKILNAGGHMVGGQGRPIYVELKARAIPGRGQGGMAGTLQVDTVLGISGRQPSDCKLSISADAVRRNDGEQE
jgi:hypothetical protein